MGYLARGDGTGAALGREANAHSYGAAVGYLANARWYGAAVGRSSLARNYGAAMGYGATAYESGVAVGMDANGAMTNVAIGLQANSGYGTECISLGHNVTNTVNDSARIRGTLYLDGGTGLLYRSTFGSGAWVALGGASPESDPIWTNRQANGFLMGGDIDMGGNAVTNAVFIGDGNGLTNLFIDLDLVVWVATNGSSAGPGSIDMPFDTPQNAYNAAKPGGAVVIASGNYSGYNLTMNRPGIHVFGLGRPILGVLTYSALMPGGMVHVQNLVFDGGALITGSRLKMSNCRMNDVTTINAGQIIVIQNCYCQANDSSALQISGSASGISVNNSSLQSQTGAALLILNGSTRLSFIGCEIVNHNPLVATVIDQQGAPVAPQHFFSHNFIRAESSAGIAFVTSSDNTIAFYENTVQGDLTPNNYQFHGNNAIVVTGRVIQWLQADAGCLVDAYGNTLTLGASLPDTWDE